mmetsp:Transcript_1219/g.3071  ORF Transcript_1219/g.3071 Transcript_1219/m.3071 type:complete len:192 (+) Transcript_1219:129-704(+)
MGCCAGTGGGAEAPRQLQPEDGAPRRKVQVRGAWVEAGPPQTRTGTSSSRRDDGSRAHKGPGSQAAKQPSVTQRGLARAQPPMASLVPSAGESCNADTPEVHVGAEDDAAIAREFLRAASQLSENELRDFVDEHVSNELALIGSLPLEQRQQAFRSLCAEWHPDKCPAIAGIATEVFQRLQAQKSKILRSF